jgi:hypothetical protein
MVQVIPQQRAPSTEPHPNQTPPRTESELLRGALGTHRADRVSGLRLGPEPPLPRARSDRLHPALQHGQAAPRHGAGEDAEPVAGTAEGVGHLHHAWEGSHSRAGRLEAAVETFDVLDRGRAAEEVRRNHGVGPMCQAATTSAGETSGPPRVRPGAADTGHRDSRPGPC